MISLTHAGRGLPVLALALLAFGNSGVAQSTAPTCAAAGVIPITGAEPPPKLITGPPLPEPLASRGVAIIPYCAQNMRLASLFGPGAFSVSPRVGHVHVTVDGAAWHWADASGDPIILRGLPPGRHDVLIELVDANHQMIDKGTVRFVVPQSAAAHASH